MVVIVNKRKAELVPEYFRRSLEKAMGYVSAYPDPDDGTILYALTLAGEDRLRDLFRIQSTSLAIDLPLGPVRLSVREFVRLANLCLIATP